MNSNIICGVRSAAIHSLGRYYSKRIHVSTFSQQIREFKRGKQPVVDALIDRSVAQQFIATNPTDYIVRALGHAELKPDTGRPLDCLGKALEHQALGCYCPHLLYKKRHVPSLRSINHSERMRYVKDTYHVNIGYTDNSIVSFLVIDDVITTGSTCRAIATAIHRSFPNATIRVFTLSTAK